MENRERIEDIHIEAVSKSNAIAVLNSRNVNISNINVSLTKGTSITVRDNSENINLHQLEINNVYKNAISVAGGGKGISITNCDIKQARNNGIVLLGSKMNPLSQTLVKNCVIDGVGNNDCITLHKDGKHNDAGSGHVIMDNILSL